MNETLKKLQDMAKLFEEKILTPDDVKEILSGLVSILNSNKKGVEVLTSQIRGEMNNLLVKVASENIKTVAKIKEDNSALSQEMLAKLQEKMSVIVGLIEQVNNLKVPENGKDADENKVADIVLSKMPKAVDPYTAGKIADLLETLKGDDRLSADAIKGLEEYINKVFDSVPRRVGGNTNGGGVQSVISSDNSVTIRASGAKGKGVLDISITTSEPQIQNIYNEYPTDAIDGINTEYNTLNDFTLGTTRVYLNGARQALGIDYTETSSAQITFTSAPLIGSILFIDYQLIVTNPTGNDMLLQDNTDFLLQDSTPLLLQ